MSYNNSNNTVEIEVDYDNPKLKQLLTACNQLAELDDEMSIYLELDVNFVYSYTPAHTYGPPENCYPSEFEYEIVSITDNTTCKELMNMLSEKDLDAIEKESIRRLGDRL